MIAFDIVGLPAPQGNKTAFAVNGDARMVEGKGAGRQRYKDWRTTVGQTAHDVAIERLPDGPLDGPLSLSVEFWFPMPASRPKKIRDAGLAPKTTAPDLDKLVRALGDGLTAGGLIANDARIVHLVATKHETTGWTGATVAIDRAKP